MEQVGRLIPTADHAFVDCDYKGHTYQGLSEVHIDKQRWGRISKNLWKWMEDRAAVEPSIGRLKQEPWVDRCRLKGAEGV